MKLHYRGTTYDYTPPTVATIDTPTLGRYRGHDYHLVNAVDVPPSSPQHLTYRGVGYDHGGVEAASAPQAVNSLDDRARTLVMNHHKMIKNREQSLLGRMATQIGMPAEAAHYWNHIQGKINPNFRTTYDRSHAALS